MYILITPEMVSLFKGHLCIKLGLSPQERGQKAEAAMVSKPKRSKVKMRKVAKNQATNSSQNTPKKVF